MKLAPSLFVSCIAVAACGPSQLTSPTGGAGGSGGGTSTTATTGSTSSAATTGGTSSVTSSAATTSGGGAGGNGTGNGTGTSSTSTTGDGASSTASSSSAAQSSSSSSSTGGPGVPTDCTEAYGNVGCCTPAGVVYYCPTANPVLTSKPCVAPLVCGWNPTSLYYGCVAAPGGADPSGTNPEACQ